MSNRKSSRPSSRKTQKRKPTQQNPREKDVRLIAAVLAKLPALDRMTQNLEDHPYNGIASSKPMQELVLKLVRNRYPENAWNAVHGPMCEADQNGRGYWTWTDALRDVSFQCGVEYAARSLPGWCSLLHLISPDTLEELGVMVRSIAENGLDRLPDAEQQKAIGLLVPIVHDQMTKYVSGEAR